jgi:threonylcarbamoyladenosine tRNA methylthiotransferase MtaB
MEQISDADVVIVNTCAVTAEADRQARAFIRRANRINPSAKIVVTGCYAQRAPKELSSMTGVAAVVGNSHKALVPEIIMNLAGIPTESASQPDGFVSVQSLLAPLRVCSPPRGSVGISGVVAPQGASASPQVAQIWADDDFAHTFIEDAELVPGAQTRPNLKIQEGCSNRCTFCVIPQTRGPSKSLPHEVVIKQVERFVSAGGNELVLSGINLGRWGRDFDGSDRTSLSCLVRHILTRTALPRLRLSSIEPMDWDDELIGLMAVFAGPETGPGTQGPRLARHAHLPLQSGSDAVLRRMHRRYRPWHYAAKVEALLRAAGPDLTLGADVMVGFPGETDTEFEETVAFIRALPFGYLHLFPFSPRPGTRGWAQHIAAPVASAVVDERISVLRSLAREKAFAHRSRMVGRELPAITLHTPPALAARGRTEALTENYLPVELEGTHAANQLLRIQVKGLTSEVSLRGEPIACKREQVQFAETSAF